MSKPESDTVIREVNAIMQVYRCLFHLITDGRKVYLEMFCFGFVVLLR